MCPRSIPKIYVKSNFLSCRLRIGNTKIILTRSMHFPLKLQQHFIFWGVKIFHQLINTIGWYFQARLCIWPSIFFNGINQPLFGNHSPSERHLSKVHVPWDVSEINKTSFPIKKQPSQWLGFFEIGCPFMLRASVKINPLKPNSPANR